MSLGIQNEALATIVTDALETTDAFAIDKKGRLITNNELGGTNTAGFTAIAQGRKTVAAAGTAEALAASTACKRVIVTALSSNTGVCVVGGSGVIAAVGTRTGIPLAAGASTTIDISNLSLLFVDVAANGEGVTYAYFT